MVAHIASDREAIELAQIATAERLRTSAGHWDFIRDVAF